MCGRKLTHAQGFVGQKLFVRFSTLCRGWRTRVQRADPTVASRRVAKGWGKGGVLSPAREDVRRRAVKGYWQLKQYEGGVVGTRAY